MIQSRGYSRFSLIKFLCNTFIGGLASTALAFQLQDSPLYLFQFCLYPYFLGAFLAFKEVSKELESQDKYNSYGSHKIKYI